MIELWRSGSAPSGDQIAELNSLLRNKKQHLNIEDADNEVQQAIRLLVEEPQVQLSATVVGETRRAARCSTDISRDVQHCLNLAEASWDWDPFLLLDLGEDRSLSVLAMFLFNMTGLIEDFAMDSRKLDRFLQTTERSFGGTYHNSAHTASVLHKTHMLFEHGGVKNLLTDAPDKIPVFRLALYLAAIVHDFCHNGRTNLFLVDTRDPLALRYNDKSVLENFHLASAFQVMGHNNNSILETLEESTSRFVRAVMIDCVLATDMHKHFEVLDEFNECGVEPRCYKTQVAMMKMCLKCADLGHVAAPRECHLRWVSLLQEEFFQQGDRQKLLKMPVSPLMDRNSRGMSASQHKFCTAIAEPLFAALSRVFPNCAPLHAGVLRNVEYWEGQK